MSYTTFNKNKNDQLKEPLFFGQNVNVARYDQSKYPVILEGVERGISFFWRPEEVDVSKDRIDYNLLPDHERHIFISNLKYQTLLDSVQGRSPNAAFLSIISNPELELFVATWAFSETVHSRSYTHIIRNIVNDPSIVFDDIVTNKEILKRASDVSKYYDDLIAAVNEYHYLGEGNHLINGQEVNVDLREIKKKLYLCLISVNVLEGVRFYVSFACTFAFSERKLLMGNGGIVKLIARDEKWHLDLTQFLINRLRSGNDDPEFLDIAKECEQDAIEIYRSAAIQEREWADYLFKDGSMIGLNKDILCQYVEYITNIRAAAIGLPALFPNSTSNPIPWINTWLNSDNVQVAPQEQEISSYLVGQINSEMNVGDLIDFEL